MIPICSIKCWSSYCGHYMVVIILWSLYGDHYIVVSKIGFQRVFIELVWRGAQSQWEARALMSANSSLGRCCWLLGLQRQGTQHHVGAIILPAEVWILIKVHFSSSQNKSILTKLIFISCLNISPSVLVQILFKQLCEKAFSVDWPKSGDWINLHRGNRKSPLSLNLDWNHSSGETSESIILSISSISKLMLLAAFCIFASGLESGPVLVLLQW